MTAIHTGAYYEVAREPALLYVVRVVRTPTPYATIADMARGFDAASAALDALGRARLNLLVDLRRGPLRTDPEFEAAVAPHRQRLVAGFARVAILVSSAVGRLQVQRHARADGGEPTVFDAEAAALAYVTERPPGYRTLS